MLGYGNPDTLGLDDVPASVDPIPVGGLVQTIAAGNAHTCALLQSGSVRGGGNPEYGKLGYGNLNPVGASNTPADAGDVSVW